MTAVKIIELFPPEFDCYICGEGAVMPSTGPSFGLPIYEDEILPDDDPGEWGGVPVCTRCYYLTRGIQGETTGRLRIALVRQLVAS